ncbi:unnamed protein product [Vitrella brassicaformis CCMP3155]|uniref:Hook C-terminal domain-containing protein n=1 Tax=Vitrella brassicaformis (strain CCMP3155) TaxID=1169540 RepID=A0A0G4GZY1_VITBC|nr:unnamed protein product [Vitrella brassicaformis CCMP3155]|eukprot:CEM36842.1 unnamed protein product [Vitrella brassicaformis CCMP3155]
MVASEEPHLLIEWVNSFDFAASSPVVSVEDFSDGQVFAKMLGEIDPGEFQDLCQAMKMFERRGSLGQRLMTPRDKLVGESQKRDGVAKVEAVLRDFSLKLGRWEMPTVSVDQVAAGYFGEVLTVLEIIVAVMLGCDRKDAFINRIMGLSQPTQLAMQTIIQRAMERGAGAPQRGRAHTIMTPSSKDGSPYGLLATSQGVHHVKLLKDLQRDYDQLKSRYDGLWDKFREMESEKDGLMQKNQSLTKMLEEEWQRRKSSEDFVHASKSEMQKEVSEQRQALESTIHELEETIESLRRQQREAEQKHKEEMQTMADEVDVLKAQASQAQVLQAQIQRYKGKMEELGEEKRRNRELEAQTQELSEQLEEKDKELRTMAALKKTLEQYKDKCADQESDLSAGRIELVECKAENDSLKQQIKDMDRDWKNKDTELQNVTAQLALQTELANSPLGATSDASPSAASTMEVVELQQRIAKLEKENTALKESVGNEDLADRLTKLENDLDDALRLKDRYEKNYQAATARTQMLQRQVQTLEAQLLDIHGTEATQSGLLLSQMNDLEKENERLRGVESEHRSLKERFDAEQQQMKLLYSSKDELHQKLMEAKEKSLETQTQIVTLQNQIAVQSEEMKRLKSEKDALLESSARGDATANETVKLLQVQKEKDELILQSKIDALNSQLKALEGQLEGERRASKVHEDDLRGQLEKEYHQVVETLREQVQLREKQVEFYKQDREEQLTSQLREKQVMVSAFYDLGLRSLQLKCENEAVRNEPHGRAKKVPRAPSSYSSSSSPHNAGNSSLSPSPMAQLPRNSIAGPSPFPSLPLAKPTPDAATRPADDA